jgi:alkanesulfonate monooxygenase SsuD/methylene tetrahydromethanopterin reductase-like flavin-dependent oxidoreductase (luciferase family)
MASIFQNPGRVRADREVYRIELRLADLAEPLGFQSIWGVEHHFTDYTMCPDVLQFLSYMAGRTTRASLGSMVVVLPWHDPMRVAEEVSMLDTLSDGRLILGLGRGRARSSSTASGCPWTSRARASSRRRGCCWRASSAAIASTTASSSGSPRADIRPAPFKSFRGRTYAAAVSPESARIMAELGVGILIIPQKPWSEVAKELEDYRGIYREVNGAEAPAPISAGWTFCDSSAERAREMAYRYIGGYFHSVLAHYHFEGDHLGRTKGYEYYGKMAEKITTYGTDKVVDFFVDLQGVGHARAVLRQDHGHPPPRGERPLRRRVQLCGDAARRGRAQHAIVRRRGAARPLPGRRGSAGPEPYGLSRAAHGLHGAARRRADPALSRDQGSGDARHARARRGAARHGHVVPSHPDAILMLTVADLQKVRDLRRDPRVAMVAESVVDGGPCGVSVRGRAEILDESPERRAFVEAILAKYHPRLERLWGARAMPSNRVMFKIAPSHVRSWGLG